MSGAPLGVPWPLSRLSVTLPKAFTHVHAAGAAGVLPSGPYDLVVPTAEDRGGVPAGDWSITIVSATGQSWKLPNELGDLGVASQAATLRIE